MNNEILFLNKTVFHECSYEIINVGRDIEFKDNRHFISKKDNLLFELSNVIHSCGIEMYETNYLNSEGRYLRITNIKMVFHSNLARIYLFNCVETKTIEYWI